MRVLALPWAADTRHTGSPQALLFQEVRSLLKPICPGADANARCSALNATYWTLLCLHAAFAAHAVLARTSPQLAPALLDTKLYDEVQAARLSPAVLDATAKLGVSVGVQVVQAA